MKFRLAAACVVVLAAVSAPTVVAGPPDPAAKAAAAAAAANAALKKQEDLGRSKAAEEIGRLALFAALKNDFEGARRDYALAIAFNGANEKLKGELAKIKGRRGKPTKEDVALVADRRAKALARCAELLAPAANAYAQADKSDELASLVQMMSVHGVPTTDLVAKLQLVIYDPYLDWRTKAAVAKLSDGWEYVDGAWADPKKVADLNETHKSWATPWVFADEVHEVRSNLPRRMARQVAAHVFAYRRFFLSYFTGEWELAAPTVKLPVIVTRTRKEMEARCREIPGAPTIDPRAAAVYLHGSEPGCPCFASIEANISDGPAVAFDYDMLEQTFEHELGHQIAYEYSKAFAATDRESSDEFIWVVEGLAEFLSTYDFVDGRWMVVRRAWLGSGEARLETAFGWVHENVDKIPPIANFIHTPSARFDARSYHIAAALTDYLLECKDREYRQPFIDLIEAVHRGKATPANLAACFPGDSLTTIDADFREWCRNLQIARPAEREAPTQDK